MIRIKNIELGSKEVHRFLKDLKKNQEEIIDSDTTVYPKISLYLALKNKIFYSNFLTHPMILKERKFYEEKKQIINEALLKDELAKVLEYEMSCDTPKLLIEERTQLIKLFTKLGKKYEKEQADI